jgi:hypothetical protein
MTMCHLFCDSLAKSEQFGNNGAIVKIMRGERWAS